LALLGVRSKISVAETQHRVSITGQLEPPGKFMGSVLLFRSDATPARPNPYQKASETGNQETASRAVRDG
jgi:hypothetical protein